MNRKSDVLVLLGAVVGGVLGYFLSHIHQLSGLTLVMIAAGAAIGFYVPFRRGQEVEDA